MTRSQMQSSVLQYTLLATTTMILYHELNRNAYDSVWADPVLKNFTDTVNATWINAARNNTSTTHIPDFNATALNNTSMSINGTEYNITITKQNNTEAVPPLWEKAESFYGRSVPKGVLGFLVLGVLGYYWHVALERGFPTRPMGVEIDYSRTGKRGEKIDGSMGENEGQEEEVIKRWIAQGKVRRSTVSWWNTFVKFTLHMTIGKIWWYALFHTIHALFNALIDWKSPSKELSSLKSATILSILTSFLSISPLASLISFIVIPAPRRLVFGSIINLAEAGFFGLFYRTVIPWAVQTGFVQGFIANVTESLVVGNEAGVKIAEDRLIDEL